ncbi:hypothetical protein H0E87_025122, partial [Populus deltoides]
AYISRTWQKRPRDEGGLVDSGWWSGCGCGCYSVDGGHSCGNSSLCGCDSVDGGHSSSNSFFCSVDA